MPPLSAEIRRLLALAVPVAATQVSTMLMGFVDTVMVGRVSVDAIAAVSLANVWSFGTLLFANGVILGIDPIVTQAHGAGLGRIAGLALQCGCVLALLLSLPVAGLLLLTESPLVGLGQDPDLSRHLDPAVADPGVLRGELAHRFKHGSVSLVQCGLGGEVPLHQVRGRSRFVVQALLRRLAPSRPARRIRRATHLRPTRVPSARSSTCTRGRP